MGSKSGSKKLQAPKGTRDLYPEETARVRYIQKAWTDTAVRHGFEEIEGPTFETSELYAVKSGEEILGELFQAFSGKSPEEIEEVQKTGRAPFALRPEFTPTLARMYAARAKQFNKPTKWFTAGPYFRAERPQRGRLREFLQWNCDVIGDDGTPEGRAQADAECIDSCIALCEGLGLQRDSFAIKYNDRRLVELLLLVAGVSRDHIDSWFLLIDRIPKIQLAEYLQLAEKLGARKPKAQRIRDAFTGIAPADPDEDQFARVQTWINEVETSLKQSDKQYPHSKELYGEIAEAGAAGIIESLPRLVIALNERHRLRWFELDLSIVRGLAYYTGTVFEAIADGERAVAGGGRYDNLIELMGGPPTPAVGFAMGDVVLGLLLEDKGLMPEGAELLDAISTPGASRRPEVFVLGADDEASDPLVRRLVADLRRGVESGRHKDHAARPWSRARFEPASGGVRPMHARQSYKSTRNLKKLLSDAERQLARFAAVVHGQDRVELRDLDNREQLTPKDVQGLPDGVAEFSVDPASEVYVGRAVRVLLDGA